MLVILEKSGGIMRLRVMAISGMPRTNSPGLICAPWNDQTRISNDKQKKKPNRVARLGAGGASAKLGVAASFPVSWAKVVILRHFFLRRGGCCGHTGEIS